jgi:hypothetical protein
MKDLVLHPATREVVRQYGQRPAHAALLIGPTGSGKFTLATRLVEDALGLEAETLDNHPYKLVITPEADKSSIGIEAVRQLEQFLALKVPGKAAHNRAVIIENAHLLTLEAQNALLKTLEEPPAGTVIILTAASEQALLPTIRSRAQAIHVTKPTNSDIEAYFSEQHQARDIKRAYAISGGLPGLMNSLLAEEEHPLSVATEKARELLGQTTYERLLGVDDLAKNKQLALDVTFILQQMAHVSLQKSHGPQTKKWQRIMKAGYQAAEELKNNAQPKLTLINLMLSL